MFYRLSFCAIQTLNFPDGLVAASGQKYISGWVLDRARKE